jgi:flagellar hook protein FlgE
MVGALWTGISGLSGQQTALDNESNNIANVNTIGYKASRISFADQMYQDKIGKGATILDAEKLYKQGNLKLTGVSYDMALSGSGFFVVANNRGGGTAETLYTRAGNFRMGDNGTLQDSAGNEVQGWPLVTLDPDSDVISTDENVKNFTDDYSKPIASQIIKKATNIETITAKATDYTVLSKADSLDVMTGAGYKSQASKISDVEALKSYYESKLQLYANDPEATSTPSSTQNSWLDFELDTLTLASGDEIFVNVGGTSVSQTYDGISNTTTLQKLVDRISVLEGINAYIGNSTKASYPSPNNAQGIVIIEGLVPGQAISISNVGIKSNGVTSSKSFGHNNEAVDGSGYGAVVSAMDALKAVVTGKQRDIWSATDIGTISDESSVSGTTTNALDKFKYSLSVGENTYSVEIEEGSSIITDELGGTTSTLTNALDDDNKVSRLAEAINGHPNMSKQVVARNINGNLVVESLAVGEEFNGVLKVNYIQNTVDYTGDSGASGTLESGEIFKFDMSGTVNNGENIEFKMTANSVDYTILMTGGSKTVSVDNGSTSSTITLPFAVTTANAAEMLAEAFEQVGGLQDYGIASKNTTTSTTFDLGYNTGNGTNISLTYGNTTSVTKNTNSDYSINSGAGAEFMQVKTNINQTASKGSLQLRLDTLGISDSAFGEFDVDSSGLITMQQDGSTFAIGQVAIALFNDNRGLEPRGDNLLAVTSQSGAAIFNINNNKTADVKAKTLELSTADLSESLVNLMVFQRAFEANAKSITTADTILNTLIQLKR